MPSLVLLNETGGPSTLIKVRSGLLPEVPVMGGMPTEGFPCT